MNLILLGAPGAGKGTQAEVICNHLSIPAISTGNIIREALKNETELGLKAKKYLDEGTLVPDDVVIGIVKERLKAEDCKNGFVLDGFPRTVVQAQALDDMGINIDKVLDIQVADQKICERLSGRRICKNCAASYHTIYKPSADGETCDKCGGQLVCRKDDHPETVLERLRVYHEQTEPLISFYKSRGKLVVIEGQEEVAETSKRTLAALEE